MKGSGANGWREQRGQAERERGLLPCARAVVSGVWGERASERVKAVELLCGRGWLSVWGVVGEWRGWFAFLRTWGERPLSIIHSGAVLLFIKLF